MLTLAMLDDAATLALACGDLASAIDDVNGMVDYDADSARLLGYWHEMQTQPLTLADRCAARLLVASYLGGS